MGATLLQLANGSSDPTLVNFTSSNPVVEPLDGPSTVDSVFDRFPEEVYQQGKDSHLYRLLSALGSDSGAGYIKQQAYTSRLQYEAEFLNFTVLNQIYGAQFAFQRLKSETYPGLNPETDALTPEDWDAIDKADQSYRQRAMEFWTGIRLGNSPEGLRLMAQAGIGVECELIENYKWVFDTMSDDPLGLVPVGTTASVNEFVIIPRFLNSSTAANYEFTQNYPVAYVVVPPSLSGRPATGTPPSLTHSVSSTPKPALLPELERNMIDLLDRLRPAGTLGSVEVDDTRYIEIGMTDQNVYASSKRVNVSRLVTGQVGVPWPNVDRSQAYFIEPGVETEAGYFYGSGRELPIIFVTIEAIHAYTEQALNDPTYLTSSFFAGVVPPVASYSSEKVGNFSVPMQAIYPVLNGLSADLTYKVENAVAIQETPLVLEARPVVGRAVAE